ncbi:MAG TPA: DUF4249 family protein [Fulvivirga sp.]|nr:DUF4249 family protein [Fulvivirga sp.]
MKYLIPTLLIIIGFMSACEEKIDDVINTKETNLIVVEGLLTNQRLRHKIKLSRPYKVQNQSAEPVSGALIYITDNENGFAFLNEDPIGSGEYYTDSVRAVFGKTYTLHIDINGTEYTASDSPPAGQQLEFPFFAKNETDDLYHLNLSESGSLPNYIVYDINWENTDQCNPSDGCKGRVIYYDLKTIDVQEFYAPNKIDFFFPMGSTIIRNRHAVSVEYQTFLRSLLSETEWRGGVFDVQRDNVPTNLSAGAIGFFAVTTVISDTVIVN